MGQENTPRTPNTLVALADVYAPDPKDGDRIYWDATRKLFVVRAPK